MCMYVFMFVFYEVSYTWFWIHRQFCNFVLCREESSSTEKFKINILNRALQTPRVIDWNRVLNVGVVQFQTSTGALACPSAEFHEYRGHFTQVFEYQADACT